MKNKQVSLNLEEPAMFIQGMYNNVPAKYHSILKFTKNTHQNQKGKEHSYFNHSSFFSRIACIFFLKLRTSSANQAGEIVDEGECSVTLVEWDWWSGGCGGKQRAAGRPL